MGKNKMFKNVDILGYKVFSEDIGKCVDIIFSYNKVHIVSGNPEVLYTGLNNKELYSNFTSKSSLIIPDGVGTQISSKILKTPVQEKIAGIEVMKKIIGECEKRNESIYLLGASEENLKTCVANIVRDYPDIKIAGYHNGFFDLNNPGIILEEIKEKKPTALFVAMGCPRQETFIIKYMNDLPCKIFMGGGGSFDVIAEKVNRAPEWMINIGMEWAYRVAKEPWRIKRLGSIPKFIWTVAKSRGNK